MMNLSNKKHNFHLSESGFTILESLVAILVVAILLIAVSPVLTLAVANRVQSRRVELATQAARAYIDGVKAGAIPPTSDITNDTPAAGNELDDVAAPASAALTCAAGEYCTVPTTATYCADGDGDGACT
ncbi:MAG: type II secretion system protein, partial [Cyanothece sp. SIO1E1]|nr:type II secretion system protein [Cyanothece sp. SIO1E1]